MLSGWVPLPDWVPLLVVVKCRVVTFRGTSYHMPGVWAVNPPAYSNALTVLPSLPRHCNTPSLKWINRLAAKYSCYLSFKHFLSLLPAVRSVSFCFTNYSDFWFCSNAGYFLFNCFSKSSSSPLLSCTSVSLYSPPFSLSTWLAVICQIPPWRLLCLNQSELTSFRLICTLGDWFSSLGIIWCSIPSLPEQIKL